MSKCARLLCYITCLVLTLTIARIAYATCRDINPKVFIWSSMASSFSGERDYVYDVQQALPFDVHGFFGDDSGHNAALGDTIAYGLSSCRTVWLMGHGMAILDLNGDTVFTGHPLMFENNDGSDDVDHFLDDMSATARPYFRKVATFTSQDWTLYSVELSEEGMSALKASNSSFVSRLVMGMYCGSTSDSARIHFGFNGVAENAGCSDAVLVGYSGVATDVMVDADIPDLIHGMTCRLWEYSQINGTLAEALDYAKAHLDGSGYLKAYGCTGNQLLPCWKDCKAWASGVSAYVSADSVRVLAQDEDSTDTFVVRGFAYPDAPPETLATFEGDGACGVGTTRAHVLPVWTNSFMGGDVIARDASGRSLWSAVFAPGDSTESATTLGDGECTLTYSDADSGLGVADTTYQLVGGEFVPRSLDPSDSLLMDPPHDQYCADVLIYGTVDNVAWYDTVEAQVKRWSPVDRTLKVQGYHSGGNTSPATAHAQYMVQRSRNRAYNDTWGDQPGGHMYTLTPMLILLGDPGVTPYQNTGCAGCGACGVDGCSSYSLITDVDGDSIQDGPVSVIPCRTDAELAKACHMADDWNAGRNRDPQRGVAVFAGDVDAGHAVPAFRDEAERVYARLYTSINASRGVLAHSDLPYPPGALEGEAAEEILDTGVSELWTFGLNTGSNALPFIDSVTGSDRKQRVVIIAPTCQSADFHQVCSNDLQEYMFRSADNTIAAGGIGVLSNGYGPQHRALIQALVDKMIAVPAGTTYAKVAMDAARTVAAWYPGYASTVTTFGAFLQCPAGLSTAGVGSSDVQVARAVRASTIREGERLWLNVNSPFAGPSRIEVFDATGRRVAGADVAGLKVGWNQRVLDLSRVSRGVYFVKLRAGAGGGQSTYKTKLVIVE